MESNEGRIGGLWLRSHNSVTLNDDIFVSLGQSALDIYKAIKTHFMGFKELYYRGFSRSSPTIHKTQSPQIGSFFMCPQTTTLLDVHSSSRI